MKAARAGVCCERGQVYSREIKVRLTCAGVAFEGMQAYSREINMKYIGIGRKPGFPMYAGL